LWNYLDGPLSDKTCSWNQADCERRGKQGATKGEPMTDVQVMQLVQEAIHENGHVCELNGVKLLLTRLMDRPSIEACVILKIFTLDAEWEKHLQELLKTDEWKKFSEKHGKVLLSYLSQYEWNKT
jgi:hypothetical protein